MEGSIQVASNDIENQYTELETSMIKELERLSPMSPSRCIFRAPNDLRRVCEEAYTPQVISIGPLHHGKESLKAMEEHKKRYLQYFMGRTNLSLKDGIEIIKAQEARLRSCYTKTIELESDEFVRVILVDAIFIIEFLVRFWYDALIDENDCIFSKPRMANDILPDLLMLENQLPFFILEDIFEKVPNIFPSEYFINRLDDFERLSIRFLSQKFLNMEGIVIGEVLDDSYFYKLGEEQHFVDLLRKLCICPMLKEQSSGPGSPLYPKEKKKHFADLLRKLWIAPILEEQSAGQFKPTMAPSIEELHLAGVKFKVRSTDNLFDIGFKDGILEIPKLKIYDSTELILRNLVAFEQCTSDAQAYISEYVVIMDMFMDTPKDVELLVKYGIVENCLGGGNNELSSMINRLSTGILFNSSNSHYSTLIEDLNKFCGLKWHKRIANLRQKYFNTPWATISFLAAVLLLILTVVQTICSIISLD